VDSYIEKNADEEVLFMDDFLDSISFYEKNYEKVVSLMVCISGRSSFRVEFNNLTITNHYYLMLKVMYDKKLDLSEFSVLIDEVHQIPDVGNTVLSEKFSIFELKNSFSIILKELKRGKDFHGRLTLLKNLQSVLAKSYRLHKKYTDPLLVGEYVVDIEKTEPLKKDILALLQSKEMIYLRKKFAKIQYVGAIDVVNILKHFHRILPHLESDSKMERRKGVLTDSTFGIFYSPSKGFPSLTYSLSNPLSRMHYRFWEQISLGFPSLVL
jgi:Rad3-related DNA helicase